jgi:hypothetical protein
MNQDVNNQGRRLTSFPSLRSVFFHLQAAGYKISIAKIYRDFKKGLIHKEIDGTVLETEARAYIVAANLTRISGNIEDLSDLHSQKNRKEIEKLDEQVAKLRFEREKEQGKYILKNDFATELAARAAVFDSGFRHLFNVKVREWIALVGGKSEKAADFLQELNQALDEQLTTYASTKTYQVLFIDDGFDNK